MTCKILHVDDHELTRSGCALLVSSMAGYEITCELDCGAAVLEKVAEEPFDLVILDVRLPDINGLSLLAELVGRHDLPVLVFTGQDDPKDFEFALRMGALGVARKNDPSTVLMQAIRAVSEGATFVSPSAEQMLSNMIRPSIHLSPRQTAILHYMLVGETNKEMAHKLDIAMPTVSFHLSEIRRKLGVTSNKKIINAARQFELV